ncbi:MAG: hypothetical protein HQK89_08655 [Nitrospirae bacterium]|nr:hypothetical protein [Nitrospirota bacterium]
MFKLIRRIIFLAILLVIAFVVIAIYYGGDKFRWLGDKAEKAGHSLKDISKTAAKDADEMKRNKDYFKVLSRSAKEAYDSLTGKPHKKSGDKSANQDENSSEDKDADKDNFKAGTQGGDKNDGRHGVKNAVKVEPQVETVDRSGKKHIGGHDVRDN